MCKRSENDYERRTLREKTQKYGKKLKNSTVTSKERRNTEIDTGIPRCFLCKNRKKNKSARSKAAEKAVEVESALLKSVHYRW